MSQPKVSSLFPVRTQGKSPPVPYLQDPRPGPCETLHHLDKVKVNPRSWKWPQADCYKWGWCDETQLFPQKTHTHTSCPMDQASGHPQMADSGHVRVEEMGASSGGRIIITP